MVEIETTADRDRSVVAKAFVIGTDPEKARQESNAIVEQENAVFQAARVLEPPYSVRTLNEIFESSALLRPNIDAYVQNIEGNGYHLEPVLDLDGDDATEIVANCIRLERLRAIEMGMQVDSLVPTEAEVADRIALIERGMELERYRIEAFFDGCTVEESFTSLRMKRRHDTEVCGNAYWEVLRNGKNQIAQFIHLPAQSVRLRPIEQKFVEVQVPVRVSPISMSMETMKRRFRTFVQVTESVGITGGNAVYFKELGDPRVMSSRTGKFYDTELDLERAEQGVAPATEIAHFKIYSPRSAYGVPRWIGALLSVLGSREAEEVNLLYFQNKSVPPLAILVSGGRLAANSADKIRDFINNEIKGKGNFHKVLVIEADSTDSSGENTGRMKIEIKPLTQAQQQDALFLKYDERNHDKVGFQFRLPRLLRGDARDFNRATADASVELAESQVFGPERNEFDFAMNRSILATLGIRYWVFRSNAVQVRDPKTLAGIIGDLTTANVLVPDDARKLASELVFNRRLPKIDADWPHQPVMLTQVGVPFDRAADGTIPTAPDAGPTAPGELQPIAASKRTKAYNIRNRSRSVLVMQAREMIRLRDEFEKEDRVDARERFLKAAAAELETETRTMSVEEMSRLLGVEP